MDSRIPNEIGVEQVAEVKTLSVPPRPKVGVDPVDGL
jgi:hypothetical protein